MKAAEERLIPSVPIGEPPTFSLAPIRQSVISPAIAFASFAVNALARRSPRSLAASLAICAGGAVGKGDGGSARKLAAISESRCDDCELRWDNTYIRLFALITYPSVMPRWTSLAAAYPLTVTDSTVCMRSANG